MSPSHGEGDIFDRLRERRIGFVRDPLDAAEANRIIAELLHLESRESSAVYNTMQSVRASMATLCGGTAAGGAALLLAAGTIGRRTALPSAQVVLEQPKGKLEGSAREIDLKARGLTLTAEEARAYGLIDNIAGETRRPRP